MEQKNEQTGNDQITSDSSHAIADLIQTTTLLTDLYTCLWYFTKQ